MLAGGLVFLYPLNFSSKTRFILELTGLLMLIVTIFYFNSSFPWPSFYSLLTILGVVLILYANKKSFITCNPLSQFIGKISYSIYLWHWPFAVFLYFSNSSANYLAILTSFLAIIILSTLSYYFIEQHFIKTNKTRLILIKYFLFNIFIGAVFTPIIASIVHKYPKQNNFYISNRGYYQTTTLPS